MKRLTMRILLCLLLGMVLNVLVAWGCALRSPLERWRSANWMPRGERDGEFVGEWVELDLSMGGGGWVRSVLGLFPAEGRPRFESEVVRCVEDLSGPGLQIVQVAWDEDRVVLAAGWPMRSLFCRRVGWIRGGRGGASEWAWEWALPTPAELQPVSAAPAYWWGMAPAAYDDRMLPLRPIAGGFAVNSVVYALCVAGMVGVVAAVRRGKRSRRGCCAGCGYDLSGNVGGVCPECGAGVRRDRGSLT